MTDGNLTGGYVPDGHLTDEELSAHLDEVSGGTAMGQDNGDDGDNGARAVAHMTRCAPCRRRADELDQARQLVRTPVPPVPPSVKAAAIAEVLRAGGATTRIDASSADDGPVPFRRRPRMLAGVAAAVVVLASVGVALPLALSGSHVTAGSSAARAPRAPAAHTGTGDLGRAGSSAASSSGPLASGSGSSSAGASALGPTSSPSSPGGAAPPSPSDATGEAEGQVTPQGGLPSLVPDLGSVASVAALRPLLAATTTSGSATPITQESSFERCLATATASAGQGRSVERLATATITGTPVLVYVFGLAPGVSGSTAGTTAEGIVVVTASSPCRLVGTASL